MPPVFGAPEKYHKEFKPCELFLQPKNPKFLRASLNLTLAFDKKKTPPHRHFFVWSTKKMLFQPPNFPTRVVVTSLFFATQRLHPPRLLSPMDHRKRKLLPPSSSDDDDRSDGTNKRPATSSSRDGTRPDASPASSSSSAAPASDSGSTTTTRKPSTPAQTLMTQFFSGPGKKSPASFSHTMRHSPKADSTDDEASASPATSTRVKSAPVDEAWKKV